MIVTPAISRSGRLLLCVVAAAALSSCAKTTPAAEVSGIAPAAVTLPAPTAATTAKPAATPSVAESTLTKPTIAPSGDPTLDALDSDLTAFEKAADGLDSAAAASQAPAK